MQDPNEKEDSFSDKDFELEIANKSKNKKNLPILQILANKKKSQMLLQKFWYSITQLF